MLTVRQALMGLIGEEPRNHQASAGITTSQGSIYQGSTYQGSTYQGLCPDAILGPKSNEHVFVECELNPEFQSS